ncbi:MAG TPA: heme o synthase [Candidatus Limnocylindrales bacterium]|jgi:protoheme IX farnesyltransferase|nr:heme o synthase [Candidatus Limnocylindrales bacterium]
MSTATQPLAVPRFGFAALARDYSVLVKARVTTLIILTTWCGAYFAAAKSGASSLSWTVFNALLGIGLVSAGTAAINEVMERDLDARMRRTAMRPLVTKSMGLVHASIVAFGMTIGGIVYLWMTTNWQTALLTGLTSASYLLVYTPMKQVHPICTFLGAFPGAMPPLLGWVAVRGRIDPEAVVLFAIMFFWQFPHFHSIAWLYREDYENAGVRMLPVVESDGRSTIRAILLYSVALIPVTLAPTLMGMTGWTYFAGALLLGLGLLWFSLRMATMKLTPIAPASKLRARHLLQASVIYLPLLFALMMLNRTA